MRIFARLAKTLLAFTIIPILVLAGCSGTGRIGVEPGGDGSVDLEGDGVIDLNGDGGVITGPASGSGNSNGSGNNGSTKGKKSLKLLLNNPKVVRKPRNACPATVTVSVTATADRATGLTYRWLNEEGESVTGNKTVDLRTGKATRLTTSVEFESSGSGGRALHILEPLSGVTKPVRFTVKCPPQQDEVKITSALVITPPQRYACGTQPISLRAGVASTRPATVYYRWRVTDRRTGRLYKDSGRQRATLPGGRAKRLSYSFRHRRALRANLGLTITDRRGAVLSRARGRVDYRCTFRPGAPKLTLRSISAAVPNAALRCGDRPVTASALVNSDRAATVRYSWYIWRLTGGKRQLITRATSHAYRLTAGTNRLSRAFRLREPMAGYAELRISTPAGRTLLRRERGLGYRCTS